MAGLFQPLVDPDASSGVPMAHHGVPPVESSVRVGSSLPQPLEDILLGGHLAMRQLPRRLAPVLEYSLREPGVSILGKISMALIGLLLAYDHGLLEDLLLVHLNVVHVARRTVDDAWLRYPAAEELLLAVPLCLDI